MSIRLSCPSCNHPFGIPALPEHRRGTCPRCGDVFPIRTFSESTEEAPSEAQPPPQPATGSGRKALWLVGLVVAVAVVGIIGVWMVRVAREINAALRRVPIQPHPSDPAPANQLAGLAYLRADSNVAFAIRFGPLLDHAARTGQQPGEVLKQTGLPDLARGLTDQFAFPPSQVDHLVGGLTIGEGDEPFRLTLVLVLKEPLADEDAFLKGLKAKPAAGKRDRRDVVLGRFPLLLERASPTVWVFGLDEKDLGAVEKGPADPPGAQFRGSGRVDEPGLRSRLAGVPGDAAVWLAADDDRGWTGKPILKLAANAPDLKRFQPVLKDGRGGLLAVTLGEQPRLRLDVRAADATIGERVRAYFAAQGGNVGGEGAFAQYEGAFDAGTPQLLQRFLAAAAR